MYSIVKQSKLPCLWKTCRRYLRVVIQLDDVYWFDDVCPIVWGDICFLGAIPSLLSYNVGSSMFFSSKARVPLKRLLIIGGLYFSNNSFYFGFVSCGLGTSLGMY